MSLAFIVCISSSWKGQRSKVEYVEVLCGSNLGFDFSISFVFLIDWLVELFSIYELYSYASIVRRSFAKKLSELPSSVVAKNREASFYSMKNILLHMIDNEDWIVGWVIPGRSREYVRKKSAEYATMEMVLAHLDDVELRTREYLKTANESELNKRVDLVLSSGQSFNLSVEECILQSFTEQLYHLGELIALFWQENIEPPSMQWFRNNPREQGGLHPAT